MAIYIILAGYSYGHLCLIISYKEDHPKRRPKHPPFLLGNPLGRETNEELGYPLTLGKITIS